MDRMLFILQRLTAIILLPLIIGHLIVILYAIKGGLTSAEILGRTQGSMAWLAFYGLFVLSVAVHAPIGLRNILIEWTALSRKVSSYLSLAFGLVLLWLGVRAVQGVIF